MTPFREILVSLLNRSVSIRLWKLNPCVWKAWKVNWQEYSSGIIMAPKHIAIVYLNPITHKAGQRSKAVTF